MKWIFPRMTENPKNYFIPLFLNFAVNLMQKKIFKWSQMDGSMFDYKPEILIILFWILNLMSVFLTVPVGKTTPENVSRVNLPTPTQSVAQ